MATLYFRGAGTTNWGTATNWSTTSSAGAGDGNVPTTSDVATLDAGSNNVNLAASTTCGGVNFTGYTKTFSGTGQLTVNGNITLSPTMSITTTGILVAGSTGTLTSNGKAWPNQLTLGTGANTYTLNDSWTVGALVISTASGKVINGFSITTLGNLTLSTTCSGTTNIIMGGSGTWSGNSSLGNLMTIAGNVTVSGTVQPGLGGLVYSSGTVTTTGSTLNIASGTTINSAGIVWNNVSVVTAATVTLSTKLTATGTMTLGTGDKTFAGAAGFEVGSLVLQSTGANNITLSSTGSYIVNNSITATSTSPSNRLTIKSNSGTRVSVTLKVGATCSLGYVDFQSVDASGGRAIATFNGVATDCINVVSYADVITTYSKMTTAA